MTDISIQTFYARARQDLDSDIRLSKDDDTKLNLGTFGQRVASWFRDIKEFFGHIDQTRAQRQQAAIDSFKESLKAFYGEEVAQQAFGAIGLGGRVTYLTGRVVKQVIDNAIALERANRLNNYSNINDLLPPAPGGQASPKFQALVQSLGHGVNLQALSEQELQEYETRLRARVNVQDLGRPIKKEWFEQVAGETLKQVHKLAVEGTLDRAIDARRELVEDFKSALKALANGKGVSATFYGLVSTVLKLDRHGKCETDGDYDSRALLQSALSEAMMELNSEDPKLLARAQKQVLSKESPLRAVYAQINAQPQHQLSPRQHDFLNDMKLISEVIVEGLGTERGGGTGSVEGDIARLQDSDSVSRGAKTRALRPVNRLLEHIHANPVAPGAFVNDVKEKYGEIVDGELQWKFDPNDFPEWNCVQLLEDLEQQVKGHALRDRIPITQAIDNFRDAIGRDRFLPLALKGKLSAALDAINAEFRLGVGIHGEGFQNLKQEDFWRLFVPERLHGEGVTKWEIEHRELGSLRGMLFTFREMLDARQGDPPQPLTVDELETLHQRATENTYNGNLLQLTYRNNVDNDDKLQFLQDSRIPTDLREGQTALTMRLDSETTEQGRQEIQNQGDEWFGIQQNPPDGQFVILYPEQTREQCRLRAQGILDDFYNRLPDAHTGKEKRLLIAETVQRLYRSHLFKDGNTRTIVFTAMNRLLLDAGLSPAILPEPKAAAGFSLQQFSDEILKGQIVFRCMSKDPSISVAQFLQTEIDRHSESEGEPVERAVERFRAVIANNEAIPEAYRNQLLTGLDRLLEGVDDEFYQNVLKEPFYGCLKRDDVWRLFAGERPDDLTRTAMERQFDVLLARKREGPLNTEIVELVNQHGPNPGFAEGSDPDQCRQKIGNCLRDFQGYMNIWKREERTESQKLSQIAMIIHELYAPPVFKDPSTGLMLLQYMMLEAGLPPAMLDPGVIPAQDIGFQQFEAQVGSGQLAFAWRTKDPSMQAETFLRDRLDGLVKTEKLSFEEACERLRLQIDGNPMISDDDKAGLLSTLNAIVTARHVALSDDLNQTENGLHDVIGYGPTFGGIKRDEIWRLFATGRELDPKGSNPLQTKEEFLVRNGPESLIRLEQAFGVMVEGHLNKVPLDSDHVMQINGSGPNPGFRQGPTVLTTRSTGFDPDFDGLERLRREDQWFRGMEIGGDRRRVDVVTTIMGSSLVETQEVDPSELEFTFTLPDAPSDELCRQRLDLILGNYRQGIEMIDGRRDSITVDVLERIPEDRRSGISEEEVNRLVQNEVERQKREVIAKAVQDLYRAQIFPEGERQWTVSMVMNRMLLDAGLPPAILRAPEQMFALNTSMAGLMIREGQNVYRVYVPKIEDKQDLILRIEDLPRLDDDDIVEVGHVDDDIVEVEDEVAPILLDDPTFDQKLGIKFAVNRARYEEWLQEQVPPGDDVDDNDIIRVDNPNLPGEKIRVLRAAYTEWIDQQRHRND